MSNSNAGIVARRYKERFPHSRILPFSAYKNHYSKQACCVVGRGPTQFDYQELSGFVEPIFFLNDAICLERFATAETFFFAHDHKMLVWLDGRIRATAVVPEDGKLFKNEPHTLGHKTNIVFYHWRKHDGEKLLRMNRELLSATEELYTHTGTIHSLLHFIWYCGFSKVKFIGCDGINAQKDLNALYSRSKGYDARLENLSRTKPWWQYDTIRKVQDRLIARFGFEVSYLGTPQLSG